MSDSFLSQEEIDALLNQGSNSDEKPKTSDDGEKKQEGRDDSKEAVETAQTTETTDRTDAASENLQDMERDALGEIGNISMGSAATTLAQLLNQRVDITTPKVKITTEEKLYASFERPYVVVEVSFDEGLRGNNLLILKSRDASIIADLMMGGDGSKAEETLSEISTSAVSEAMNQMIGSAATSMSDMFQKGIKISPPNVKPVDFQEDSYESPIKNGKVVVVSFRMVIGDLIDSEIMQIIPLEVAREEVNLLMGGGSVATSTSEEPLEMEEVPEEPAEKPVVQENNTPAPAERSLQQEQVPVTSSEEDQQNLNLILDVPLKVSVLLGRTKRPIGEVLAFANGSIVELEKLADEPVEVLVNGTLIARGEVVVVNENFGVKIKSIVSPEERINNLR